MLTFPENSQPGTLECADVEKVPNEDTFGVVLQSPSGANIAHLTSTTVRVVDPESATLVARDGTTNTPDNDGEDKDGGTTNTPNNGGTNNGNGDNDGRVVDEGGLNSGGVSSTSTILSLLFVTLTVVVSTLI